MKKSELISLIENTIKKVLSEGFDYKKMMPTEVQEYYVKNSGKFSGDQEEYQYSYQLKMPYETGEDERDIEEFLKKEHSIGMYNTASQPGGQFNHESVSATLKKQGNEKYWLVNVSSRGGLDI